MNVNDMNMNIEIEKDLNLKWNEMKWNEMKWNEMKWDIKEMIDDEILMKKKLKWNGIGKWNANEMELNEQEIQ